MSAPGSIEVPSYRAVFDLERRVYRIDRLRLNPGGVPLRGFVYCAALALAMLVLAALPVSGLVLQLFPWYLRDIAVPAAGAALLSIVRVEGRCFHFAALSLARHALGARCSRGLRRCRALSTGRRWHPPELLFLPDGSDARLRRLRFTGPGAALVTVPHACATAGWRVRGRAPRLVLCALPGRHKLAARGQVLELGAGVRLDVYGAGS
jgi:hypothetical protein